jgi:hypothetical protein
MISLTSSLVKSWVVKNVAVTTVLQSVPLRTRALMVVCALMVMGVPGA